MFGHQIRGQVAQGQQRMPACVLSLPVTTNAPGMQFKQYPDQIFYVSCDVQYILYCTIKNPLDEG
jgi:hypothetical protein